MKYFYVIILLYCGLIARNPDAVGKYGMVVSSNELASEIENSIVLFISESRQNIEKSVENHRFGLNGIVAGYIGTLEKEILENQLMIFVISICCQKW